MLWSLLLSSATAAPADTTPVDLGPAMADAKKPVWEPKGKALDPYGRAHTKEGAEQWADALPLLNEALTDQPGCGKCLDSLGKVLVGMKHFDDALKIADRVVSLYPDRKEGVFLQMYANSEAHRAAATVDAAEAYLAKDPGNVDAWYERNHDLALVGRAQDALTKLDGASAAGLKESDIACMKTDAITMQGDLAAAREVFVKCDASGDAVLQQRRTVEGRLLVAEGDLQAAQGKFSQGGAELESRMTLALVRLGEAKYDQALNLASRLVDDAPWALDPQLTKAQALVGLGKADEAETALKAHLLADGWQEAQKKAGRDETILASRSTTWPADLGVQALATEIGILVAKGDTAGAQALHDEAVKVHGANDAFEKAMTPPATAPAPASGTASAH